MKQDINTKREREKAMVTQMIALYCRKNHHGKALCPGSAKAAVTAAFRGTKYRLTWVCSMDAWYKCHLAFILPVCYLSYTLNCDLTRAKGQQIRQMLDAVEEGYRLLSVLGYPILPEDTLDKLHV